MFKGKYFWLLKIRAHGYYQINNLVVLIKQDRFIISKMFINIIQAYRDLVAVCDKELLGKRFEEGNFQLDVKENFYKGNETGRLKVIEIMKKMSGEDATFNIVGEESVSAALEAGIISKAEIGKIHGIPFALILL